MDRADLERVWERSGGTAGVPLELDGASPAICTLLGLPRATSPASLAGAQVVALGLPMGGWDGAPAAVRAASARYARWFPTAGSPQASHGADYGDVVPGDDLAATFVRAHERLADVLAVGATPLVLGGDALVTVPVLQVLSGKLHGKLGVVAFTAGFDSAPHPVYAPTSRWARALELGLVEPDNLTLIGGRLDPPGRVAHEVLDELGAHLFAVDDVVAAGMAAVVQEALEHATAGTEATYLSVDLGVLEATDPAGLTAREVIGGVRAAAGSLLAAADICGVADDAAALVAARAAAEVAAGIAAQRE